MTFKKKLLFNIGISFGIFIILGIILFLLSSEIRNKAEQIQETKKEAALRSQITKSISLLRHESKLVKKNLNELDYMLITKYDLLNFSYNLNNIAEQSQVGIRVSLGKEISKADDELGKVNITIIINGALENLVKFFNGLENSQYIIKLNNVDLTKRGDNFKGTLNGVVFYY